jgi:hypothetical protein
MRNLPIFTSSFDTMRDRLGNYIYVDKTEHIYNLFKTGISHYYFLSRPRRFGKTLLISTLKELFSGNKALFKGLWIEGSNYEWVKYPVIHLNFGAIGHDTVPEFKLSLSWTLAEIAREHALDISDAPTVTSQFIALVKRLAQKNKVVILIDEYDKPVLDHINNKDLAIEQQDFLQGFYGILKGMGSFLRAIFITGVSQFAKASLFSNLNNLDDITFDPRAASLLGYTDEEVDQYFASFIEEAAMKMNLTKEVVRQDIRTWYNGYRFSELDVRVYNPFSILYCLHDREFSNYWFESGSPFFLVPLIKNQHTSLAEVTEVEMSSSDLENFDLEYIPLVPLLFQTGYLTIADYNEQTNMFKLGYPNFEVEESFKKYIVVALSNASPGFVTATLTKLKTALKKKDLNYLCTALERLFAKIPYTLQADKESHYHALFQFLMDLLSLESQSDVLTNQGRIDNVLAMGNRIFLFEFKLNASAKSALKQIIDKRYYQHFLLQAKPLTLVGLSFSHKPRKVTVTYAAQDMNPGNHPTS